jgi:hypothetical protein
LVVFPVTMRSLPTLTSANWSFIDVSSSTRFSTTLSIAQASLNYCWMAGTVTGVTSGDVCVLVSNNTPSATMIFSAEL